MADFCILAFITELNINYQADADAALVSNAAAFCHPVSVIQFFRKELTNLNIRAQMRSGNLLKNRFHLHSQLGDLIQLMIVIKNIRWKLWLGYVYC